MKTIKKMNLIDKLYQPFVINRLKENDRYPLIIEFDPTSVCNFACPGCISEDILKTKQSFSKEKLLQTAKEFIDIGVKGVILIGGGEPLSHPNIGEFITLLGENDIHIGITTNGYFIDKLLYEISQFSKWTRVSVDAATEKTFNIIRPLKGNLSAFNKVIKNMELLAKHKKGKLGFSFLVRSINEDYVPYSNIKEVVDAAKLAKSIGCDYFEVKPSYQYKEGSSHKLVKYTNDEKKLLKDILNKLEDIQDENFKVIKAITLDDAINEESKPQPKSYTKCPVSYLRTLITPLGIYVCPYWRGNSKFKIGDIREKSFIESWYNECLGNLDKNLNPSIHCEELHCLRHESNLEILKIKEKLQRGEQIDLVEEFDRFI